MYKNIFITFSYTPILLCQCVVLYLSNKFENPMPSPKGSVHIHSLLLLSSPIPCRDIFFNQNIIALDKYFNQQEGILTYKVINGTYLLNGYLNHGDVRHQLQLRNIGDLNQYLSCICTTYNEPGYVSLQGHHAIRGMAYHE